VLTGQVYCEILLWDGTGLLGDRGFGSCPTLANDLCQEQPLFFLPSDSDTEDRCDGSGPSDATRSHGKLSLLQPRRTLQRPNKQPCIPSLTMATYNNSWKNKALLGWFILQLPIILCACTNPLCSLNVPMVRC
jgi:hypothetical protein